MAYNNDVWRQIEKSGTSNYRKDNVTIVRNTDSFKAMPLRTQESINAKIANAELQNVKKVMPDVMSASEVRNRVQSRLTPVILNSYHSKGSVISRVSDIMPGLGIPRAAPGPQGFGDGYVGNYTSGAGMPGTDPAHDLQIVPNVWISPGEANAIYSQKGIPELIIKKKSQSILINGVRIRNPYFKPEWMDRIRDNMIKHDLADHIAQATNWSLVYGGSLMFPMFKEDSPVSMHLPMQALLKAGIVKKNCIDRFVTLDRWNVIHIPQWNPTAADFLNPREYFIPFLGCDVSGDRCARVVTAPQAGYLGNIMTLGWGISDMNGWYESVLNYMTVMSTIPTMINQMSILARTINVDGVLATEGELILDEVANQDTIRVRHSSTVDDPINLDVIGNLQAIQRDFKEVPELMRLIRQDFCARANIPEELILSSERGAFSSGDTTEGALEKQWEAIKYIHKDVAKQLRYITYLIVIDALGVDREVMKWLPYTTIEFDNPALTDAAKKADFFKKMTEGYFNEVSGLMPAGDALAIAAAVGETDFPIDSDVIEELKKRQKKLDAQADEKHELEMELLRAQVKQTQNVANNPAPSTGGSTAPKPKKDDDGKGHSYDSRLQQRQSEHVAAHGKTFERIQKAQNA